MYPTVIGEDKLLYYLTADEERACWETEHPNRYRQLSLFDDMNLEMMPTVER